MKLRVEVPSATQSPAESTSLNLIQNLIQRLVKPKWIHSFIGSFRIKEHPERIRKQPIKTKQTQVKLKLVSVTLFSPSLYLSTFSAQQSTDFILKRWNWELQCQVSVENWNSKWDIVLLEEYISKCRREGIHGTIGLKFMLFILQRAKVTKEQTVQF